MAWLTKPLTPKQKVAFIMSPRLGDGLLSMIVVHNLLLQGIYCDVYSDHLFALQAWFPKVKIYPFPVEQAAKNSLQSYDVLLHAYATDVLADARQWHPQVIVLDESPLYRLRIPMVDIQVEICQKLLELPQAARTNGLVPLKNLKYRQYPHRVIIHPTSHQAFRSWSPKKFVQLARFLQAEGYQPEFIVSAQERPDWLWLQNKGFDLPEFANLNAVASWIYESGWMIGNDSGIGHLASNLGIPTLTIAVRARTIQRWRPAWIEGRIVLPPAWLMPNILRKHFWKYCITVKKVTAAFKQLVSNPQVAAAINKLAANRVHNFKAE